MNGSEGDPAPPQSVELLRVSVPLRSVHRSANAVQSHRESVIVRLVDTTGSTGVSECPTLGVPGYVTETTDEAWTALLSELAPAWLAGHRVASPGSPAASAAMADSALDAHLRRRGVALADHLSAAGGGHGDPRTVVPWCAVLADVSITAEAAVRAALAASEAGASMLKFKFVDPGQLRRIVTAVRGATALPLAADANGSLSARASLAIDDLDLCYLEQPLPVGTPWGELADLRAGMVTPVGLDESLPSPDALADALREEAIDVACVKAPRMGGVMSAATAVRLCADRGVDCLVGGMFELGIGRATALAVAAMPGCTLPADLGPSARYFERDLCDPLVTDPSGAVVVPAGAGIGRTPDDDALAQFGVDRVLLSR